MFGFRAFQIENEKVFNTGNMDVALPGVQKNLQNFAELSII